MLWNEYKLFSVYASPDICDEDKEIWIEVTEVITNQAAQIESEFAKYRLECDNSKKERRKRIIDNNGGRI